MTSEAIVPKRGELTRTIAAEEVAPHLFRVEKVAPSGWSWNMLLVRFSDGSLLIQSPTWAGEGTFEAVEAIGRPTVLFAPNHFHHLHLERFRQRYPQARAVASNAALPRLRKQGHEGLTAIESLSLPSEVRVIAPPGLKNGEVWLAVDGDGAGPTLVVSDSFFHLTRRVIGLMGFALRVLGVTPGLRVGRTFRWVGVKDRKGYRAWARETLVALAPARLACSHGDVVASPTLGSDLVRVIDAALS